MLKRLLDAWHVLTGRIEIVGPPKFKAIVGIDQTQHKWWANRSSDGLEGYVARKAINNPLADDHG